MTQVLADGTNVYLYGNGRIAQYGAGGVDYFLGDALGSVRQLADANGNVVLAKSYEPYGELMDNAGSAVTSYGYTGEFADSTGLIYLRARYLDPKSGRFLQRDRSRLEANLFLYAAANPVNRIDPSGLFSRQEIAFSFGMPSFDAVVSAFAEAGTPLSRRGDVYWGERWGFLAALLNALPGDNLSIGGAALESPKPYIHLKNIVSRIDFDPMQGITIGGLDLRSYLPNKLNEPTIPHYQSGGGEGLFFWRDTTPHYYFLNSSTSSDLMNFVDL